MVWLVTHMWVALGLAALLGILLGGSLRGLLLKGKARKAIVDRDIAIVELEQSKREIDQLYAAQNKLTESAVTGLSDDSELRAELKQREVHLRDLSDKFAAAQEELGQLKKQAIAGAAAAGVAGVATSIVASGGKADAAASNSADAPERLDSGIVAADASLEWKNRYLASRVRVLENEASTTPESSDEDTRAALNMALTRAEEAEAALADMKSEAENETGIGTVTAALAAGAAGAAAVGLTEKDETTGDLDKVGWQNHYLRQRLAFAASADHIEGEAGGDDTKVPVAVPVTGELSSPSPENELSARDEGESEKVDDSRPNEVESWKAGYLAQRLSYLEENPLADREALYGTTQLLENADTPTDAMLADSQLDDAQADGELADPGELEQELARLRWRNRYLEGRLAYISGETPDAETIAPGGEDETHADAVLAAMDAADQTEPDETVHSDGGFVPEDGGDDLTKLDGVDSDVESRLNALGVWYFHQIADWTPENVVWIDANLGVDTAVDKSGWIAQAGALSVQETA